MRWLIIVIHVCVFNTNEIRYGFRKILLSYAHWSDNQEPLVRNFYNFFLLSQIKSNIFVLSCHLAFVDKIKYK